MAASEDSRILMLLGATGLFGGALAYTYYRLHQARKELDHLRKTLYPAQKTTPKDAVIAAVECGGTTCRAGITMAESPTVFLEQIEIPTTTPEETISKLIDWLNSQEEFDSIGIASFGPVDLHNTSETYGHITTTPKRAWRNCDLVGPFQQLKKPIGFDTDVNGPALAELVHGGHS